MADEIGSVEVSVRARIDRLESDLRKAEGATKKTATKMKGHFNSLKNVVGKVRGNVALMGAALGAVSAGALANMAKNAIRTANDLGDVASKLGISTDALQEFQFAAGQSGVPINAMNMGLQRFGRRAAEASEGMGEAKDAIRQLGIQLKDSNGNLRSTEELFVDAMKALGGVDNQLQRVRLGFKLFDSEGVALVNMADNFEQLRAKARDLGVVIDESMIERSDELQDRLDALDLVIRGNLSSALIDLGGTVLVDVAEGFAEAARWAKELWVQFGNIERMSADDAARRIELIDEELRPLEAQEDINFRAGAAEDAALSARIRELWDDRAAAMARIHRNDPHLNFLTTPRGEAGQSDPPLSPTLNKKQLAELEKQKQLARRAREVWLETSGQQIKAIEERRDADIAALDVQLLGQEEYKEAETHLRKSAFIEITAIQNEQHQNIMDQIEDEVSAFEGMYDFMERGFSDAMASMLLDGEITFKALAQSFLREFMQIGLGSLVKKGFSTLASLFDPGPLPGDVDFMGPTLANGGPLNKGPALVGERGPELFIPGVSGFVASNHSLRKMMGGGAAPVTVTVINNSGSEATTTERDGPNGSRAIEVMIGQAISKNIARGGNVDQAIRNSYGVQRVGRHGV